MKVKEIKELISKMEDDDRVNIIVSDGEYSHFFNEIADIKVKNNEMRLLFRMNSE
jgi:hypothetical protein